MSSERRIALVTGVGRREGIGFEVCRQLARSGFGVLLTARSAEKASYLAESLRSENLDVEALVLDVTDEVSRQNAATSIQQTHGKLDVLINNAAPPARMGEKAATASMTDVRAALEGTLVGTWTTTQVFLPLLRASAHPRIVNVSSGAGSHGDSVFGLKSANGMGPSYAVAKAALNALTSALATELASTNVLVNAVCPGFTATFVGAESMGARPVRDGAAGIVWAATLPDDGPRGGFFRDGDEIAW